MTQELIDRLGECLTTPFETWVGRKVPHPGRLSLKSGGIIYRGSVLYADVVKSTALGERFGYDVAAKIIQSYLLCASRLASAWDGEVTAYDGDRVMAVFGGDNQVSNATACALALTGMVRRTLNPMINETFNKPSMSRHLSCCCGIDTGEMLAIKVGVRGNTDLLWSGRPANFAAKMCAHRRPFYSTVITGRVFQSLSAELKRSKKESYWSRFPCEGIDMEVFGSNADISARGV